jgi:hypothetical protein
MRGPDPKQGAAFSDVSPEERVPADHPLRKIRPLVDGVLKEMSPQFGKLYSEVGRPCTAPERLLPALLLQIFYSVRSERLLMERWISGTPRPRGCGERSGPTQQRPVPTPPMRYLLERERAEAGVRLPPRDDTNS